MIFRRERHHKDLKSEETLIMELGRLVFYELFKQPDKFKQPGKFTMELRRIQYFGQNHMGEPHEYPTTRVEARVEKINE